MSSEALPYTELLRSAEVSFAEACNALERDDASAKPSGEALAYPIHCVITGVEYLALFARRYAATTEFRSRARGEQNAPTPILSDAALHNAASDLIARIDTCKNYLGVAGARLAATIRNLVTTKAPEGARLLAAQCQTTTRGLKRKATH